MAAMATPCEARRGAAVDLPQRKPPPSAALGVLQAHRAWRRTSGAMGSLVGEWSGLLGRVVPVSDPCHVAGVWRGPASLARPAPRCQGHFAEGRVWSRWTIARRWKRHARAAAR